MLQALRFPQAVREASSALKRLRGLPCPVLLQESRAFRTNQHSSKINSLLLSQPNKIGAFIVNESSLLPLYSLVIHLQFLFHLFLLFQFHFHLYLLYFPYYFQFHWYLRCLLLRYFQLLLFSLWELNIRSH